ncbi:MAG: alpha/beta hydrolase [Cyclobacteriaceae bacterium]
MYKIIEGVSIESNVVYKRLDSMELKLDVYFPATKLGQEPWDDISEVYKPTLIYFHGGGWIEGDRTSRFLGLLPYLEKKWCVVNVDYRLLSDAHLLEILEDCFDAINWVGKHSSKYKFDLSNIYLSGESAGGHLALLAGMSDVEELGIQRPLTQIKGIINWYGITDMKSAIAFWNDSTYTKIITEKYGQEIDKYLQLTSPVYHIGSETPPIITIHGDADLNVPIEQAISFHQALDSIGIANKLIRVNGKKHGDFSAKELTSIYNEIWHFFEISDSLKF